MKLPIKKRAGKKSETQQMRREGSIPAVIYVRGKPSETISVNGSELNALMRKVAPGRLSTNVFELNADGKIRRALIKDIQYDPTTYNIIHLDFEELIDDVKIKVKVPVECTGVVDCVGIKLGGVLRQVIRHLRVSCLPKDMPTHFMVDVRALEIKQVKRLADLEIPNGVRPLADLNEVAVVIAKR
jgi:large subunit ribosomal protein L25